MVMRILCLGFNIGLKINENKFGRTNWFTYICILIKKEIIMYENIEVRNLIFREDKKHDGFYSMTCEVGGVTVNSDIIKNPSHWAIALNLDREFILQRIVK